ncbi:MAG: protein kinase [Polyangiaceae bacterium]
MRLGRYDLVAEIASGGMATVFLGRLAGVGGFQRFVAIKRLHPHLARDADFVEMFIDEARLAARIHHPNVVPIAEIELSDDGHYLVMDYIEGDTVGRLLAKSADAERPLPPAVAVRIVVDALRGLHAAHELKDESGTPLLTVHRDVSPQNILVGVDGISRITDFGVAHAVSRLSSTRTGQLKGKLSYMAPEQARGKAAGTIDRRADLFAMGIVLWEVLAGERLFRGESDAETLNKMVNEPIPSLRSRMPNAPEVMVSVVAQALERDRDKRFRTADDFAEALERAAKTCGWIASHKDVANHVDAVLGTVLHQHRESIRQWVERSSPTSSPDTKREGVARVSLPPMVTRPGSVSAAAVSVPRADERQGEMFTTAGAHGVQVTEVPDFRPKSRKAVAIAVALVAVGIAVPVAFSMRDRTTTSDDVARSATGGGRADTAIPTSPVQTAGPAASMPSPSSAIEGAAEIADAGEPARPKAATPRTGAAIESRPSTPSTKAPKAAGPKAPSTAPAANVHVPATADDGDLDPSPYR